MKFLVKHPDSKNRAYGKRVLTSIREMFGVIHRRDEMTAAGFARRLRETSAEVQRQATYRVPAASEARNLANRFHRHGESYLRFVTTPGIEPTNNLAEQAIRFVVIDRRITQGSRSEAGRRWLERIWTTIATCTHNGISVFNFLHDSIAAHFQNVAGPSFVAIDNSS